VAVAVFGLKRKNEYTCGNFMFMKILLLLLFFCGLAFSQEKPCGREINEQEILKIAKIAAQNYEYAEEDYEILSSVSGVMSGLFGPDFVFDMRIFSRTKKEIGFIIYGQFDDGKIKELSCYLFSGEWLPGTRYLLLYDIATDEMVAPLTNEK